ncbi:2-hydroxyhexa-2,4-dienoate hydratase (plasmid) [Streptomyces xanthophaeus]|uniref:2-keto-4-pentenoate hydratase n=1 Tax=Streptomyces xanthophaeus TaxID=67385 RepID=UPI00233EF3A7|nr:fumarylacetoacetate hydrolase family protein [Streptomyces xanthophaeus]WCD91166.1 2-hydroxyhexa-2,4-dienoate hydratase [Streptomyces xanthophaeus]
MARPADAPHDPIMQSTTPGDKERLLVAVAAELGEAARSRVPVRALAGRFPGLTLEDAYRIQQINVERRILGGARVAGHKIGLTSPAMQQQMRIHEPDSGFILDGMVQPSGSLLWAADFMNPRIETEIAFRLGHHLTGPADLDAVRGAVAEVFLAFEVLDTCYTGWNITLVDSVADNAACARVVLGSPVPFDPAADLAAEQIEASVNGHTAARGEGHDILGDPLKALVWLTHRLPALGTSLRAGDIVLAGSVHASIPLTPGMDIRATSTHFPAVHLHVL